jgi:hypothetical protein
MEPDFYEPIEFKTWWENQPIAKGTSTEYAMRQVALVGWIEGRAQGYAEAKLESVK